MQIERKMKKQKQKKWKCSLGFVVYYLNYFPKTINHLNQLPKKGWNEWLTTERIFERMTGWLVEWRTKWPTHLLYLATEMLFSYCLNIVTCLNFINYAHTRTHTLSFSLNLFLHSTSIRWFWVKNKIKKKNSFCYINYYCYYAPLLLL